VTVACSENPDLFVETTDYTWEAMVDMLMHIETMDLDKYADWMKADFYETMLDEDVDIIMRCGDEKWAVRFPIVECLIDIRSHPMFYIGRGAFVNEEVPIMDAAEEAKVNELLDVLKDMVKVGRRRYICRHCVDRHARAYTVSTRVRCLHGLTRD